MKIVLNETQIEQIAGTVNASAIASAEMKDDLIDHLCCMVEDEMSKGKEFETAYREALQRFCPNGLDEIQSETVFLMPSKSRKKLERTLNVSGFISLTGVLATVIMKMLHVPGAGILFLTTAFVVLFMFFPAVFVRLFRHAPGKKPIYYYFGFSGALFGVIAVLLHTMHWPGTSLLLLLAVVFVYIAVFPLFFFKSFKKSQ